jgi:hypothetical protein
MVALLVIWMKSSGVEVLAGDSGEQKTTHFLPHVFRSCLQGPCAFGGLIFHSLCCLEQ